MKPVVEIILEKDRQESDLLVQAREIEAALAEQRQQLAHESSQVYQTLHHEQPHFKDVVNPAPVVDRETSAVAQDITINEKELQQALIDRILYDR